MVFAITPTVQMVSRCPSLVCGALAAFPPCGAGSFSTASCGGVGSCAVLPKDEFSRARPGKLEGKLELGCGDVVFHEPILFVTSSLQALVVGMIFSRFFPRQMSDLRQNQNLAVPNAKRRRDATHLEEPTGRLRRTLFHVPSLCRAFLLGDLDSSSSRLLDDDDDAVLSVHGP